MSNFNRGFASVGLNFPKKQENIGSVLRACGNYGAAMLAVSGERYKKHQTDTMRNFRHMPFVQTDDLKKVVPYGATPVCIDLVEGAHNLVNFVHPESAFYIFGPEDGTLGPEILEWCKVRVMIPTKNCMNLAATVNVVLYDRMAKQQRARVIP